jgi:aldehyde:ferredoxin oxidoreductase
MNGGYIGKVLKIDLTEGRARVEELPRAVAASHIGGKGLGAYYVHELVEVGADPLDAGNVLVFATGPLTGTMVPTSSRTVVCTKSPLTGGWVDSNAGGHFGPEVKQAGFDAIVVRGRAPSPVYIRVEDGQAEILDAGDLWGLDTFQVDERIREREGRDFRVACIGPAGEGRARLACVVADVRAFGRGGAGAVMGSKNLKAIAVRGAGGIGIEYLGAFRLLNLEAYNELAINPDTGGGRKKYGTNVIYSAINEAGLHPVRNFQSTVNPAIDAMDEQALANRYYDRDRACFACPIACSKIASVKEGPWKGKITEGPEYENMWAFGADVGVDDIGAVIHAEYLCDKYGLDGISTGAAIAWAMECYQRGLLTRDDVGYELRFGDGEALIRTIEAMGERQGFGELLGEGVARASREVAGGESVAMHVKGLELPAYDPRGAQGMGLAYATSDRGGCHLRSWPVARELLAIRDRWDPADWFRKAEYVKGEQDLFAAIDSAGVCLFSYFALTPRHLVRFLTAVTGYEEFSSATQVLRAGERVYNLTRLFNLREGLVGPDELPGRLVDEPLPDGPKRGQVVELQPMLEVYYRTRGWDEKGAPKLAKLRQLGLESYADILEVS